jgi:2-haloacid dehalogenase
VTSQLYVFDLYGTLVDYNSLRPQIYLLTPNASSLVDLWRLKQLQYSFMSSMMGRYVDFDELTAHALDYAAAQYGVQLDADSRERLIDAWSQLPPYPDVRPALEKLRALGAKLAVLSNGTPPALARTVTAAGLDGYFDALLSVDSVKAYKPRPEVYHLAVERFGLSRGEIGFVSSNGWDAVGAAEFGFDVTWCNRNRLPAETFGARPARTIATLAELPAD